MAIIRTSELSCDPLMDRKQLMPIKLSVLWLTFRSNAIVPHLSIDQWYQTGLPSLALISAYRLSQPSTSLMAAITQSGSNEALGSSLFSSSVAQLPITKSTLRTKLSKLFQSIALFIEIQWRHSNWQLVWNRVQKHHWLVAKRVSLSNRDAIEGLITAFVGHPSRQSGSLCVTSSMRGRVGQCVALWQWARAQSVLSICLCVKWSTRLRRTWIWSRQTSGRRCRPTTRTARTTAAGNSTPFTALSFTTTSNSSLSYYAIMTFNSKTFTVWPLPRSDHFSPDLLLTRPFDPRDLSLIRVNYRSILTAILSLNDSFR